MNVKSVGAVLLLLPLGAASGSAQVRPSFPSETKLVTVDVVVTDDDGRPIAGLKREDFVVKENGVVQSILEFEAIDVSNPQTASSDSSAAEAVHTAVAENAATDPPGARSFFVVLDDVNLTAPSAERVRTAVKKFLEVSVREGDRVTLAPTAGGAWWTGRMTDDRDDLQAALESLRGRLAPDTRRERMSDYEAMMIEVKRDQETISHVTQRYALGGLVGPTPTATEDDLDRDPLDLGQGYGLVRATASEVYHRAKQRTLTTLLSLERAVIAVSSGRGRRAVILASEGFMHDEGLPEFQRVREAARRTNAVLYFIDARSLQGRTYGSVEDSTPPDPMINPSFTSLEMEYESMAGVGAVNLAEDTGGFAIRNSNDLAGGLARISGESRTFYLLGYEPKDKSTAPRFRKLQVEVHRPGVKVRARKGYYGGEDPKAAMAAAAKPAEAAPEALRALDAPNAERGIPLRMTTYVLGAAAAGERAKVLLHAEADPEALELLDAGGDTVKGALESFSTVAARDTGELGRRERLIDLNVKPDVLVQMLKTWVPVSHSFELPPGKYQATIVVRDKSSGRVGSIRDEFEVPRLPGLRVTSPILTDTQRGPAGAPPVPIPIARRKFPSGTRLFCSFAVEGAGRGDEGPRVTITYEVRRSAGTVVTRAGPTPLVPDGQGALGSKFALTLHRPGIYEMHITARDERSGEEATAVEAFIVEAAS
jgi:VWFA-related protein